MAFKSAYSREEPLWLPAGLLAVLVLLLSAISATAGEVYDSGWSSTNASQKTTPTLRRKETKPTRVTVKSRSIAAPRRTVNPQPLIPAPRHRGKLRLVAFDDPYRAKPATQSGSARLRSIVVEQDGHRQGFRIAQENVEQDLLEGINQSFDEPGGAPPKLPNDPTPGLPGIGEEPMEPMGPMDTLPEIPIDDPPVGETPMIVDPFDEDESPMRSPSDMANPDQGEIGNVQPEEVIRPSQVEPSSTDNFDFSKASQDCSEALAELKASRIAAISLHIHPEGAAGTDFPFECNIHDGTPYPDRSWAEVVYMWKASGLCHKPLYFENVQLERYGHSWGPCLQPIMSGAHFFVRLPALPYCMGLKTPNECVYTLGHYRPGSCSPYLIEPIPFTWRAAAFEAGAWTGGVFAIP